MNKHSDFNQKCYELLKLIPEGKVTTYQEMARALNSKAWRAVGSRLPRAELVVGQHLNLLPLLLSLVLVLHERAVQL